MDTGWEKFYDGPNKTGRDRVHVTLNKKSVLLLNRRAFELLGSPKAAVLFFHKEKGLIGITSAHLQLNEAFPVRQKNVYWTIQASPFCRRYGIRMEGTVAFRNVDIDRDGMLLLDLKTTISASLERPRVRR